MSTGVNCGSPKGGTAHREKVLIKSEEQSALERP